MTGVSARAGESMVLGAGGRGRSVSLLDRLWGRGSGTPLNPVAAPAVDEGLEQWVAALGEEPWAADPRGMTVLGPRPVAT